MPDLAWAWAAWVVRYDGELMPLKSQYSGADLVSMTRDINRRTWALLAAGAIGIVGATTTVAVVASDDSHPKFCTNDAVLSADGSYWLGRDPDQGCQLVVLD